MNGATKPPHAPQSAEFVLRVFRIEPGQVIQARTLSARLDGLATHYVRGKSLWCNPERCDPALHKTPRYWKGYYAAEIWFQKPKLWAPYVIEVTEALELDFRGKFARGQIWQIERLPVTKQSKPPVTGVLLETRNPEKMPPAFDILPTVQRLYHETVTLGVKSWIPARTIVTCTKDDGPCDHLGREEKPASAEDYATLRELMKQQGWNPEQAFGMAEESGN